MIKPEVKNRTGRVIERDATPDEAELIQRVSAEVEADKDELLARGREIAAILATRGILRTLKAERLTRNMSLDEIGASIGMDAAALQAVEDSDNPDLNAGTLLDYARAVGVRLTLEKIEPRTNAV